MAIVQVYVQTSLILKNSNFPHILLFRAIVYIKISLSVIVQKNATVDDRKGNA